MISLFRPNHSWLDNANVSYASALSMALENQLADRDRWHAEPCSVAKVLTVFNTKTAFLVLRECFYGTGRFEDFVECIGASAPAVSRALKQLESAQIGKRGSLRRTRQASAGRVSAHLGWRGPPSSVGVAIAMG